MDNTQIYIDAYESVSRGIDSYSCNAIMRQCFIYGGPDLSGKYGDLFKPDR